MNCSGMTTSTRMIGSRIAGLAFSTASLTAMEAAILNAISLESTSWYDPSKTVALTSTIGIAGVDARLERRPDPVVDRRACTPSGSTPPTILSTNSIPVPVSRGSSLSDDVAVLALAARLADEAAVALGQPA